MSRKRRERKLIAIGQSPHGWGMWDLTGGAWIGTHSGPCLWEQHRLANVACGMVCRKSGRPIGSVIPRAFDGNGRRNIDLTAHVMDTIVAIASLEEQLKDARKADGAGEGVEPAVQNV